MQVKKMKLKFIQIRKCRKNHKSGEKGQAFLLVLILLLVGTLIISSTLAFIGASIKTNGPYISNTNDLYAAEAGVQDGENNVLNQTVNGLNTLFNATNYNEYDYADTWSYNLPNQVNNDSVNVSVQNVWVPAIDDNTPGWYPTVSNPLPGDGAVTPPSQTEASTIINDTNLVVTGGVTSAASKIYKLNIAYIGSVSLPIISVGVWLPQGFTYNTGSSNLQGLYSTEQVVKWAGNEAVIWSFPSTTTFSNLQNSLGQAVNGSFSIGITFTYATALTSLPDALGWIDVTPAGTTTTGFPYYYSWNADVDDYNIISVAGHTQIQTYVPASSIRGLGSAINGDYVTAGGSLMTMGPGESQSNDPHGIRYTLLSDDPSTVNNIPTGSSIVAAYLYWSGWLQNSSEHLGVNYGTDYGTEVNFSINGHQVCFNGSGGYLRGSTPITSTENQTQPTNATGNGDYSYSCNCDVTALVQGELKAETGNASNPGNATYDIGPASGFVLGDTGNEWSYAGWSLILIYSGPTTFGHQLYLYDTFRYAAGNGGGSGNGSDIDPTGATNGPGGVISGFIVPQEITGETNAASFTAFVGEGDWCYAGDFIAFNAPSQYWSNPWSIPDGNPSKLWDGITLSSSIDALPPYLPNTASQPDNVWNTNPQPGSNIGGSDGVDIKTFYITWDSGLLQPGATSARIDLPTQVDAWNLIYMIFSFRSSVTSGGPISYLITHR